MESVETAFSSVALTSIGWRRDRVFSMPEDEFEAAYEQISKHELTAHAEGPVQLEVETEMLENVEQQVQALEAGLAEDEVLVVLSRRGVDEPKTHEKKKDVIVEGENRLYFHWWLDPGLRMGVFRKRG